MWRHNDDRSSYYRPCWPAWPGVVPGIPGFDVPCSSTSFTRCSQRTLTRCSGPSGVNKIRSVRPGAMGIDTGPWTPGSAPSTWRSANCVQAPTSRQWLLQRRKRSETALITVVAHCYLAGVSTRRMDKLVKTLGITGLSKSQVSRMATDLDEHVEQFRNRPLDDAGPFTFVAADALTMKVLAWIIVHGEQRYRCAA